MEIFSRHFPGSIGGGDMISVGLCRFVVILPFGVKLGSVQGPFLSRQYLEFIWYVK